MDDEQRRLHLGSESESKGYISVDVVDPMFAEMLEPSPEPVAAAENRWKRLLRAMRANRSPPTNDDHVPILVADPGILELAPVLTAGFRIHTNSAPQDGNGGGNYNNGVSDDEPANVPTSSSPANLVLALWVVALLTLSLVITTVLYKPARGVVFGRNKAAYYITLGAIFVAGIVEVFTAMWLSRSQDANRRRFSFGRAALCISIGPFVAIIGIGGFAFTEG